VHRATYCARNDPLPLLPSGPGGVGGITSRRTRHENQFITSKDRSLVDAGLRVGYSPHCGDIDFGLEILPVVMLDIELLFR